MWLLRASSLLLLPAALAADVLKTEGFTNCLDDPKISVDLMDIQYDKDSNQVTFDVAGRSSEEQNVTATLVVTAYGKEVYQKEFDPCADDTKVDQLCPGKVMQSSCSDVHPQC